MKTFHFLFILCLQALLLISCGSDSNDEPVAPPTPEPEKPSYITGINAIVSPTGTFAKDDGASALDGSSAKNVARLLEKSGPDIIKGMGNINISEAQYKEIKTFTDKLVEGKDDVMDIYREIFKWITVNIKYASGYVDNDPYPVFQTKQAICQGYANLLTVMLHSQDIPCMNANGMLNPVGGHAWNYVWLDEWYVSDPTNNGHFRMADFESNKHLDPMSLDAVLFEDEHFVFNFYERHLNLRQVKQSGKQLTVPFSTNGFKVTSFNPVTNLPSEVEEIYIGKNIETLGESIIGLNQHAPSVKYAYVDKENKKMESYGQVVYRNDIPYYVPASAETIQFKGIATFRQELLGRSSACTNRCYPNRNQDFGSICIRELPQFTESLHPRRNKGRWKCFLQGAFQFQDNKRYRKGLIVQEHQIFSFSLDGEGGIYTLIQSALPPCREIIDRVGKAF